MPARLLLLTLAASAGVGCAGHRGPQLHVLLLNGGDNPQSNYRSHVRHLEKMYALLRERGLDRDQISVFASDGEAPARDLAVSQVASEQHAWLLEGTFLDRSLRRPVRYENTWLEAPSVLPATREHLDSWFHGARSWLDSGDTLLIFVTDHGQAGKTPKDTSISLWQKQSLSVEEFSTLLGRIPSGIRVVTAMSQCYSGAFAETALELRAGHPMGAICGYFSTTAKRRAYGCYSESNTDAEEGHAFTLLSALRRSGSLSMAHEQTLVLDQTPNVPLRSSDIYARRVVEQAAARRHLSFEEMIWSLADSALTRSSIDAQTLTRIAATFSFEFPTSKDALSAAKENLTTLHRSFENSAQIWETAMGEVTQATLDAFLAANPKWQGPLAPDRLENHSFDELAAMRAALLQTLRPFAASRSDFTNRVSEGRERLQAARLAAFRTKVRQAALLRAQTTLVTAVGRYLLASEGTVQQRRDYEALVACEDLNLPPLTESRNDLSTPRPTVFPSLSHDEAAAQKITPGSFGMYLGRASESDALTDLPEGAATVLSIDPDSPAEAAGFQPGDILLGGIGDPVRDRGGMKLYLASATPEAPRDFEVIRFGKRIQLRAVPRAVPAESVVEELSAAGRSTLERLIPFTGQVSPALQPGRPKLLFFWATWCSYCKEAIPELLALERERGPQIIAITDEPARDLRPFFHRWRGPFPRLVAIDKNRKVNESFDVLGYPTFILIDAQDRIQMRWRGYSRKRGLPVPGWKRQQ